VPLIVPCHRVVRTDGTIGQYSLGGPENKRTILAAEGLDPDAMEAAARRGERLIGCASTNIVCWPTCWTGRHMLSRNRRPFRSLAEASAAGYRPCKVCRPVSGAVAA
jgi:Metal binding domain of Ada/6-O-methylguanine DNA methyltransferase, DNA binding domain